MKDLSSATLTASDSFYNGHLRGREALTPVAERLYFIPNLKLRITFDNLVIQSVSNFDHLLLIQADIAHTTYHNLICRPRKHLHPSVITNAVTTHKNNKADFILL